MGKTKCLQHKALFLVKWQLLKSSMDAFGLHESVDFLLEEMIETRFRVQEGE